jgi:hypothetical protein
VLRLELNRDEDADGGPPPDWTARSSVPLLRICVGASEPGGYNVIAVVAAR